MRYKKPTEPYLRTFVKQRDEAYPITYSSAPAGTLVSAMQLFPIIPTENDNHGQFRKKIHRLFPHRYQ